MQRTYKRALHVHRSTILNKEVFYLVGIGTILFPILLWLIMLLIDGTVDLQPSLSHYYYTPIRILYTSFLILYALFLFLRRPPYLAERRWSISAGICTIGTLVFPTVPIDGINSFLYDSHLIFAFSLFIIIAIKSIRYFSRNVSKTLTIAFKSFGYGLLLSLIALIVFFVLITSNGGHTYHYDTVFYIEAFMMCLMGTMWLIKGKLSP